MFEEYNPHEITDFLDEFGRRILGCFFDFLTLYKSLNSSFTLVCPH